MNEQHSRKIRNTDLKMTLRTNYKMKSPSTHSFNADVLFKVHAPQKRCFKQSGACPGRKKITFEIMYLKEKTTFPQTTLTPVNNNLRDDPLHRPFTFTYIMFHLWHLMFCAISQQLFPRTIHMHALTLF